ncbi:MAG TPA: flagellar biosynthetic protein FliQ [Pirellulaceae bacterium]|nr:flagellar biosynthetic protein FliQ [Pirellulaceae bacterium]
MQAYDAIELAREAIVTGLWLVAPILIAGLVIAIAIGLLQSLTQIHDATLSFIPKVVVVTVVVLICFPWMASRLAEFSTDHLQKPLLIKLDTPPSKP